MTSSLRKIIPLLLFLFVIPSAIFPVTVLLREGGKVRGEIITQNQSSILLQTEAGKRKIDKDEVLKVLFQDIDEDQEEKIRKEEEEKISSEKREIEEKEEAARKEEERLKQEQLDKERDRLAEENKKKEEVRKTQLSRPWKAAIRSAVLPGWGQFYSDRKFFGVLYPTFLAFAAFQAYDKFRVYRVSVSEYGDLNNPYTTENILLNSVGAAPLITTPTYADPVQAYLADRFTKSDFQEKREEADRNFNQFQGVLWVAGGIYLWNILDAYLFANSGGVAKASEGKSQGLILSAMPSPAGSGMGSGAASSSSTFGMETKYTLGYRFEF